MRTRFAHYPAARREEEQAGSMECLQAASLLLGLQTCSAPLLGAMDSKTRGALRMTSKGCRRIVEEETTRLKLTGVSVSLRGGA